MEFTPTRWNLVLQSGINFYKWPQFVDWLQLSIIYIIFLNKIPYDPVSCYTTQLFNYLVFWILFAYS